jgi:hypothetical protein
MKTGIVVAHDKPDTYSKDKITAVVLRGLTGVREGQHLKNGEEIWTVTKRHWVNKSHVALYLNSRSGSLPAVGQTLEILIVNNKLTRPNPIDLRKPLPAPKKPKKSKPRVQEDIPIDEETK